MVSDLRKKNIICLFLLNNLGLFIETQIKCLIKLSQCSFNILLIVYLHRNIVSWLSETWNWLIISLLITSLLIPFLWYNLMKWLVYTCLSKTYSLSFKTGIGRRDSIKVEEQSTLEGRKKIKYHYQSSEADIRIGIFLPVSPQKLLYPAVGEIIKVIKARNHIKKRTLTNIGE